MGGLQKGQVFYLNIILVNKEGLSLSEKQGGMFPSEITKTLHKIFF